MGLNGIFLINKPFGWSSYRVVGFLKKKFKFKKIGHGGTLDPLATGLLIVLIGNATKKFKELQGFPKEYEATIEFGKETDTQDREGKIISEYKKDFKIKKYDLESALKKFKGEIKQIPPIFSALKLKGKPAYKLARKGEKPKLDPRKVTVYKAGILEMQNKRAKIYFKVSSGTYIRSLARDIGKELGFGGYLFSLKRTAIGNYGMSRAKNPDKIKLNDIMHI